MKVLIADRVSPKMIDDLNMLGAEVIVMPDVTAEDLADVIGDATILIVRSKKVTKKTIDSARSLSLIVRAGAGVNTIDLDAASRSGTYVANCPGKNTDAVAELAIGLLIASDRGIADATQALRQGLWQKGKFGKASGLKSRTLGIIGAGSIGMAVARRAKALDMKVIAWSRSLTQETAHACGIEFAATPLELARKSDAISIHVASTPETRGLIDAEFFSAMKQGAIFVNTARGEIVDHSALLHAVNEKGIKAGLDVFADEPAGGSAPFDQLELSSKVVCTPHIGASTAQSEEAIAAESVNIVRAFINGDVPPNVVNVRSTYGDGYKLVIRHYNRVGVLARILDQLRDEDINIEEMQNLIFNHADAACCSIKLDKVPSSEVIKKIEQAESIIEITTGK